MKTATMEDVLEGRAQWAVVTGENQKVLEHVPDRAFDVVLTDPPYAPRAMKNAMSSKSLGAAGNERRLKGRGVRHQGRRNQEYAPPGALGPLDPALNRRVVGSAGLSDRQKARTMKQRRDGKTYDFGYAGLAPWERIQISRLFSRLAERWVVVWCDIESDEVWRRALCPRRFEGLVLPAATLEYVRTGVWVRTNGAPQYSGDRPGQAVEACVITKHEDVIDGYEAFIVAHPEHDRIKGKQTERVPMKKQWNDGGAAGVYIGPIVNSQAGERMHSSPKPLWLMQRQVAQFSNPGDLILDAYCGSATTGVAAIRAGRRFVGIERNPLFAAAARERMEAESRGLTVTAMKAKQTSIFDFIENQRNHE